ncbi:hypothetical protein G3580_17650 [Nitrogeniibacter mangrovi]|uniref:Uncharacterized protein n=1 Tax=Nitrogeniibacter mangrovi TaxID=2016596 RepID=A0A6C1B6F4_9RHOO|nr:hypothetical protein [Nitrogeniibacter mangrovi]QID19281.1 hypothetical protein G3580_17650 [Nitrogeniibacter mangrovi]
MTRRMMRVVAALTLAAGVAVVASADDGRTRTQSSLAPRDCVCSPGVALGGDGNTRIYNCQCGAMQCVAVSGSGQLQCR